MKTMLTWLIVGLFIGWNLPQPSWAKAVQDKVVTTVQSFIKK